MIKVLSKKLRNILKVSNIPKKEKARHCRKFYIQCLGKFFICISFPFLHPPMCITNWKSQRKERGFLALKIRLLKGSGSYYEINVKIIYEKYINLCL